MRYFVIELNDELEYHVSGRSINAEPKKHPTRMLYDYELFFVLQGNLDIGQQTDCRVLQNDVLIHRKGEPQNGTRPTTNDFFWLHFDGRVQVFNTKKEAAANCNEHSVYFAEHFTLIDPERIVFFFTQLNHYTVEGDDKL